MRLAIPHLVSAPFVEGEAGRLGWPADHVIKGLYMRGDTAAGRSSSVSSTTWPSAG